MATDSRASPSSSSAASNGNASHRVNRPRRERGDDEPLAALPIAVSTGNAYLHMDPTPAPDAAPAAAPAVGAGVGAGAPAAPTVADDDELDVVMKAEEGIQLLLSEALDAEAVGALSTQLPRPPPSRAR
jgi:hypothetical protein